MKRTLFIIMACLGTCLSIYADRIEQEDALMGIGDDVVKVTTEIGNKESIKKYVKDAFLLDSGLRGMELKFTDTKKRVNLEVSDGEFLELNFKIPYYVPPEESFVSVRDIKTIDETIRNLEYLRTLPLQEYVQPYNQKLFEDVIEGLKLLNESLGTRLFIFSVNEDDLKTLSK